MDLRLQAPMHSLSLSDRPCIGKLPINRLIRQSHIDRGFKLTHYRKSPACHHSSPQVYAVSMKRLLAFALLLAFPLTHSFAQAPTDWKAKVAESMPLLGHRNWILIVDSAYPLQSSPGVETIETGADQLEVVTSVLDTINHSIHVRPDLFMDTELSFVPDQDAPGVSAYRAKIAELLRSYKIQSLPHEKIIANIDQAGKTFHILVLKTTMTIPYTSVFIQLNCKYWSDADEARLRAKMNSEAR